MKFIATLFILFLSFFATAQTQTNTDYQNIQGKWTCTTPKYKNHTFWVKGMSFFQNYKEGVLEQGMPYEIRFNHQEEDIDFVGLFIKCIDCYDDIWTIQELSISKLVLVNYETDEISECKKKN